MEELKKKILDLKTVCMDRLDAITADGRLVGDLFNELVEALDNEANKKGKK